MKKTILLLFAICCYLITSGNINSNDKNTNTQKLMIEVFSQPDSADYKIANLKTDELESLLQVCGSDKRIILLNSANTWKLLKPGTFDWIVFLLIITANIFLMSVARKIQNRTIKEKDKNMEKDMHYPSGEPLISDALKVTGNPPEDRKYIYRFFLTGKQHKAKGLFLRDFGSLSYDMATHCDRAEVSEYRGILHWHRDATEKFISLFLVLIFTFFLSKAIMYSISYLNGDVWRLFLIPLDLNIVLSFIGFALIIDGLIIVAAMTDAPGVGRTLDSIIVVLAGVIVLLVEAKPGRESLVTFSLGENPWMAAILAFTIAILFFTRWIIRHHTIDEWKGNSNNSNGNVKPQDLGANKQAEKVPS